MPPLLALPFESRLTPYWQNHWGHWASLASFQQSELAFIPLLEFCLVDASETSLASPGITRDLPLTLHQRSWSVGLRLLFTPSSRNCLTHRCSDRPGSNDDPIPTVVTRVGQENHFIHPASMITRLPLLGSCD